MPRLVPVLLAALFALGTTAALAADDEFRLVIENHKFDPAELTVPAGKKIKLIVRNLDSTPEEFESVKLNREKVIPGGGEIVLFLGPLQPGTYDFFGEFHADTAKGEIIVK